MVTNLIENYMEILVLEVLNELKSDYNLIPNSDEFNLIQIVALNELYPVYFPDTASAGVKKSFLLDKQRRVSVLAKIVEAIDIVRSGADYRPSHS